MDCVDKPQNYKEWYGFATFAKLYLNIFLLKTLKLGWLAFFSVIFQLKCLDF